MLAWHFLRSDGCLNYGRPTVVKSGQTLRRDSSKLKMCHYGLHAAVRPLDALRYAPGPIVCRVKLGGTIIEDDDKCVASRRTVLWVADASKTLRLFACWCVRHTPLGDGRVVLDLLTDERLRNAFEVAERYTVGGATEKELDAVFTAARGAATVADFTAAATAFTAAWAATFTAAWAADRDAVSTASWGATAATFNAAWGAARAAASAAASAAAMATDWDAAHAVARDAQNTQLEKMLIELHGGDDE